MSQTSAFDASRPSRRGVDRNVWLHRQALMRLSRPSRRGVDRNCRGFDGYGISVGSPLTQGRGSKLRRWHVWLPSTSRPSRRGVDRNREIQTMLLSNDRSPLTQGRGSKHKLWLSVHSTIMSPLTQGRGSKHSCRCNTGLDRKGRPSRRGVDRNTSSAVVFRFGEVAPHAGAWIETFLRRGQARVSRVAPHAGAWIETSRILTLSPIAWWSPLTQGRGSKPPPPPLPRPETTSPLTQGRGSKLLSLLSPHSLRVSPLTQGRGSKPYRRGGKGYAAKVAPHAGAWIETACILGTAPKL